MRIYTQVLHDFSEIIDAGSSLLCVYVENSIIAHSGIVVMRIFDFYLDDFENSLHILELYTLDLCWNIFMNYTSIH